MTHVLACKFEIFRFIHLSKFKYSFVLIILFLNYVKIELNWVNKFSKKEFFSDKLKQKRVYSQKIIIKCIVDWVIVNFYLGFK